jgi:hypothetical protein
LYGIVSTSLACVTEGNTEALRVAILLQGGERVELGVEIQTAEAIALQMVWTTRS